MHAAATTKVLLPSFFSGMGKRGSIYGKTRSGDALLVVFFF